MYRFKNDTWMDLVVAEDCGNVSGEETVEIRTESITGDAGRKPFLTLRGGRQRYWSRRRKLECCATRLGGVPISNCPGKNATDIITCVECRKCTAGSVDDNTVSYSTLRPQPSDAKFILMASSSYTVRISIWRIQHLLILRQPSTQRFLETSGEPKNSCCMHSCSLGTSFLPLW